MADDVGYTPGSGATIAADEIAGVLYQRVKLAVGADGAAADLAAGQAEMAASLPVVLASDQEVMLAEGGNTIGRVETDIGDAMINIGDEPPVMAVRTTMTGSVNITDGSYILALTSNGEVKIVANDLLPVTGGVDAYVQGYDPVGASNCVMHVDGDGDVQVDVLSLPAGTNNIGVVLPYASPSAVEQYTSPSDITDTADDAAFAAVADIKHAITHFSAMNAHATVGTWVYLKNGSTVIYSGYCAPAGGGFVATFPVPLVGSTNAAINVANATTGSAVRVNVSGYQAP